MSAVVLCPKCGGQGHVSKPPWVPGDWDAWLSNSTGGHTCPVCSGQGFILVAEPRS
jgi:hypothetical protein